MSYRGRYVLVQGGVMSHRGRYVSGAFYLGGVMTGYLILPLDGMHFYYINLAGT